MYEERTEKSSVKGIIVQILLMVMFIFILIWLFPTKSDLDKLKPVQTVSSLEPLYDRIFNDNIISMKDAAKSYYTTPRLPKNIGDSVSMTLGEMIEKKIILPFTDSNGNQCDMEESYVKVTKEDEEFVMKVNLKCSDQENYLLVMMGCYNYCEANGICEKNESDVKTPVINPSKPQNISKPTIVRPVENNYITNNYITNNNTTNNNTTNNITNNNPEPSNPDTPVDPSNPNNPDTPVDPSNPDTPTVEYTCKYEKNTGGSYSAWGEWSDWSETREATSTLKQERYKTVTMARKETQLIGYKTVTYKDPEKPIYGQKQVIIGEREETSCLNYGYVYTTTNTVDTNVSYGNWQSEGLVKLYSTPQSSDTVRYTKISTGTETCGNCSFAYYTIYKKEVRTITKNSGSSSSSTSSVYKCLQTQTVKVPVYALQNVIVDYDTSTKREPVYGVVDVTKDVTLYSYRTRSFVGGTTDTKWSNCNDTKLLNNGYIITEKKQK